MRFHVCALPHTHTTDEFVACAFTAKIINFCKILKSKGHTVYLYGGERNEAPCDEHIVCVSEEDRLNHVNGGSFITASFDYRLPFWQNANNRIIEGIKARAEPKDFVCVIGGLAQKQIADALPHMITVEFGIGYGGTFSKYRVFESQAWMHACYGAATMGNPNAADGGWWDAVIPGFIDMSKFPFEEEKDDYLMFIGRLIDRKGYRIAADVAFDLNTRLVVCGEGDAPPVGCDYRGLVGPEERGKLLSKAKAVFVPTLYLEPFGNVVIEAQACGTPVITTDWGAFTETVEHGVTGFRCRTFGEFKRAVAEAEKLDRKYIRQRIIDNYSLERIADKYDEYFERLSHLWGRGWYEGCDFKEG